MDGLSIQNTFAKTLAPRVKRSMARQLRATASASPFSTPAPPTTRTATTQAPESTSKLQAPLRVVLGGERRMASQSKSSFPTSAAPRVHRSIARRLRATAKASPFSIPAPSTKRTATAQAPESTSKLQAPLRVVLVQSSVFRWHLSRLGGERNMASQSKSSFATTSTPRMHRSMARRIRATASA